eukprot:5698062-Amphidinium_carterae.1
MVSLGRKACHTHHLNASKYSSTASTGTGGGVFDNCMSVTRHNTTSTEKLNDQFLHVLSPILFLSPTIVR